jgi:hypothetical protein
MIAGEPAHQRSTHTNYLINLLKSAAESILLQQRGVHYTDLLVFVKPAFHFRYNANPTKSCLATARGAHYTAPFYFVKPAFEHYVSLRF